MYIQYKMNLYSAIYFVDAEALVTLFTMLHMLQ